MVIIITGGEAGPRVFYFDITESGHEWRQNVGQTFTDDLLQSNTASSHFPSAHTLTVDWQLLKNTPRKHPNTVKHDLLAGL